MSDKGKTDLSRRLHVKREQKQRETGSGQSYSVPDRARPSRLNPQFGGSGIQLDKDGDIEVDTYGEPIPEQPGYYSTSSNPSVQKTPHDFERQFGDITITDYPNAKPFTDMSKAPLFFGKPGQFTEVTTWLEVTFLTNDELANDKRKQAATFATLFRGPVLKWFGNLDQELKDDYLSAYPKLKEAVQQRYEKSDTVKQADAARRISNLYQRKNVAGFAQELDDLADILDWPDSARAAQFKRGLKRNVREALVATTAGVESYTKLVAEAERIDAELFSIRRPMGKGHGSRGTFKGRCNSCGQFGHEGGSIGYKNTN
ncbi:hypothetical protein ABZX51_009441 [Aspergillus tubingensis]